MEDLTVRRLTKKVFPYLWVRHKLMSSVPSTGIFPFSEMTVFSQVIGNAVIVYLHMYRPTLSYYLEKHIPLMPQLKRQFWTHVGFLCLQVRLINDNVFDYILTTCAITAEVALHCYMHGYDDVLSLASSFFCAFFENELSEGFYNSGGWEGLHRYIEDTSCKELYELVDCYIKELVSPSDHLPIFISIQYEQLAAGRREKLMSLLSFKIGEIEREAQTNTLVSGIFHWYFMENHRMSEPKPGILRRMENVRPKKSKSNIYMDEGTRDESSEADEIRDAGNKIYNVDEPLCLHDEAQPLESCTTMSETRLNNKAIQTLDDSKFTKLIKSENLQCSNNETSEKTKFNSSSSLCELRNFYESLSASSERKVDGSKYSRSNYGTCNGMNSPAVKELVNRHEKINSFERYPKSVSYSSENGGTFQENKNFTHETVIRSTKPFHVDDAISEFTKSFQELGFKCLCVGNSSHLDEKPPNFANYAEVKEKCRHFQNKYPSIQFAILIPNNCFTTGTSHAPETGNCDEILSKNECNEQQFSSITEEDFNNCTVSPQYPHSEIEKTKFESTKVDKNQFRLANGLALLKNCTTENIHKSRFAVTKVKENDLSIGETSKISRFSVIKVNENQMILRDETNLLDGKCATEPTIVSRFRITKVNENQSKDGTSVFVKNWTNEMTKLSRQFTVAKVNENQSKDGTSILEKTWKNEMTKISRFTVTKVDESQSKDGTSILGKTWKNETTKISRFTVTKVNENESTDGTSILRKNWSNETTKISRFTVRKVDENQPMSRSGMSLLRVGEISGDTENEAIHFQDNGSVKYQKRVSFNEHPFISFYKTYSSDESSNSITSRESIDKNSPEDTRSSKHSGHEANQEASLSPPTLRNATGIEKRRFFQRFSSGDSQSLSDDAGSSNTSSDSGFFKRIFRRSTSSNSKVDESPTENEEEMDKQKIEEDVGNFVPYVFKI